MIFQLTKALPLKTQTEAYIQKALHFASVSNSPNLVFSRNAQVHTSYQDYCEDKVSYRLHTVVQVPLVDEEAEFLSYFKANYERIVASRGEHKSPKKRRLNDSEAS